MASIIHINNLSYKNLFSNLQLDVKQGSFLSIIGRNGSGKSVLLKILLGLIPIECDIEIDGLSLKEHKQDILKKIGVVFEQPDSNFVLETPREDMKSYLRNLDYTDDQIAQKITIISQKFEIENLLDYSVANLSGGEKQIIALAIALLNDPKLLLLDDAFSMVDGVQKEKIYKILKKINREQKTTIVQVIHDIDDALYGKEVAIIDEGRIVLHGKNEKVFEEEKTFKKAGLELPFMASLSSKLKFYELVDTTILDMDKMVNVLWK